VVLTAVATSGWILWQADVKTAFLNSDNPKIDYVRLPKQVVRREEDRVRILQKALYGLKRASKVWNDTFTAWAIASGFTQSDSDPCIFYHKELGIIMAIYVDDLLFAGEQRSNVERVFDMMQKRFKSRLLGMPKLFLGMNISYDPMEHEIHLSQKTYIEALIAKYNMQHGHPRALPMMPGVVFTKDQAETGTAHPFSSLIGAILFLSGCTRPDITYPVNILAKFLAAPGDIHWRAAVIFFCI
jgi:hypothetical protein